MCGGVLIMLSLLIHNIHVFPQAKQGMGHVCGLECLFLHYFCFLGQNAEGRTCNELTHCWLTGICSESIVSENPKRSGTWGPQMARGLVRSSRATEMGKLHFAQSHNSPAELDYYFHSSQVLWSRGGAGQGARSQGADGAGLGWVDQG